MQEMLACLDRKALAGYAETSRGKAQVGGEPAKGPVLAFALPLEPKTRRPTVPAEIESRG
jgi:hypothetical protein